MNYSISISAAICSPVVLILLILVVCVYKAYKTTLQRLILYHIIFSLLCELPLILLIRFSLYGLVPLSLMFPYTLYIHGWSTLPL